MCNTSIFRRIALIPAIILLANCRLVISTGDMGHIVSESGQFDCAQPSCAFEIIEKVTGRFTAVPVEGFRFIKWKGMCITSPTEHCEITVLPLEEKDMAHDGDIGLSAVFESSSIVRNWYRDEDGDYYGTVNQSKRSAAQPDGFVASSKDCNDRDAQIHLWAKEIHDGQDNNCNGLTDEGYVEIPFYLDSDEDGYGDADFITMSKSNPAQHVANNFDCNDLSADDYPGATELFDNRDNDCDGETDEGSDLSYSDGYGNPSPVHPFEVGVNPTNVGPLSVLATHLARGTRFASTAGKGTTCSLLIPCSARTAIEGARAGDVVFLRGGIYRLDRHLNLSADGYAGNPITVESYPDEIAVFDGSDHPYHTDIQLLITGSYYAFRRIEIRTMPIYAGLWISGHHNLVEGVYSHHNIGSGIQITRGGSFNVLRSCTVNDNSGVGIFNARSANGGNSDGISISSGDQNRVEHCAAYRNSDDGIDTWQGTNTYVGHSIAAKNGLGDGDGNGFKAGGAAPSRATLVEHSLAYQNTQNGFDANAGVGVRFRGNTAWGNGRAGYFSYASTVTTACITSANGSPVIGSGEFRDNSWQRSDTVRFVSVDPSSTSFLVPTLDSAMGDIGAFGE